MDKVSLWLMTMVSSQRFVRLIIVSKHLNVLCYWVAMNASSWSAVPGTWLSISGSPNRLFRPNRCRLKDERLLQLARRITDDGVSVENGIRRTPSLLILLADGRACCRNSSLTRSNRSDSMGRDSTRCCVLLVHA